MFSVHAPQFERRPLQLAGECNFHGVCQCGMDSCRPGSSLVGVIVDLGCAGLAAGSVGLGMRDLHMVVAYPTWRMILGRAGRTRLRSNLSAYLTGRRTTGSSTSRPIACSHEPFLSGAPHRRYYFIPPPPCGISVRHFLLQLVSPALHFRTLRPASLTTIIRF